MALHVLNHPLAHAVLTELRDERTSPRRFRRLCNEITTFLVIEATRLLPTRPRTVRTPIQAHTGVEIATPTLVVPVLRAGLGMVEGVLTLLPDAQVAHVGIQRDEASALPKPYYTKIPPIDGHWIFVVDPMLATGGTLVHAVDSLKEHGGKNLSVLAIVAAPEGVKLVEEKHPDVTIFTAALDERLDERKFIVPGLGDFGDRLMGTL
jgi:uracil phosphoribosyltransferase